MFIEVYEFDKCCFLNYEPSENIYFGGFIQNIFLRDLQMLYHVLLRHEPFRVLCHGLRLSLILSHVLQGQIYRLLHRFLMVNFMVKSITTLYIFLKVWSNKSQLLRRKKHVKTKIRNWSVSIK